MKFKKSQGFKKNSPSVKKDKGKFKNGKKSDNNTKQAKKRDSPESPPPEGGVKSKKKSFENKKQTTGSESKKRPLETKNSPQQKKLKADHNGEKFQQGLSKTKTFPKQIQKLMNFSKIRIDGESLVLKYDTEEMAIAVQNTLMSYKYPKRFTYFSRKTKSDNELQTEIKNITGAVNIDVTKKGVVCLSFKNISEANAAMKTHSVRGVSFPLFATCGDRELTNYRKQRLSQELVIAAKNPNEKKQDAAKNEKKASMSPDKGIEEEEDDEEESEDSDNDQGLDDDE